MLGFRLHIFVRPQRRWRLNLSTLASQSNTDVADQRFANSELFCDQFEGMALRSQQKDARQVIVRDFRFWVVAHVLAPREFLKVLFRSGDPQIAAAVIEGFTIDMINHNIRSRHNTSNSAMHRNPDDRETKVLPTRRSFPSVSVFAAAVGHDVPIATRENRQEIVIDQNLAAGDLERACHGHMIVQLHPTIKAWVGGSVGPAPVNTEGP